MTASSHATLVAPTVLVIGAGAIGAFYGAALARAGASVCVVCRSDYEAVANGGFRIRSALLGDQHFEPARVLHEATQLQEAPDYVILSVKVLPSVDRVALLRPAVGPRTTLVLIQNGVDIDAEIHRAFPDNELLSVLAFIGVARTGPGVIEHQALGNLTFGKYPDGPSRSGRALASLFDRGGVRCQLTDAVTSARWRKAVWNAAFNSISIMGAGLDTAAMLACPEGEALVRRALSEVCAVAAALGHPQPEELIEQYLDATRAMPAYKTSMALDREHGRPLELEAILGNTVRAGRQAGAPIPTLETLYGLAKMIEGANSVVR